MAAGLPAARLRAGPQPRRGHLVAAQAGHGQLRRRRPGRPGPHRQAQAEEDPVPAPPDRRLPGRNRPENRTLVITCTTSSVWLGIRVPASDRHCLSFTGVNGTLMARDLFIAASTAPERPCLVAAVTAGCVDGSANSRAQGRPPMRHAAKPADLIGDHVPPTKCPTRHTTLYLLASTQAQNLDPA